MEVRGTQQPLIATMPPKANALDFTIQDSPEYEFKASRYVTLFCFVD